MKKIEIDNLSGASSYDVYVSDYLGNNKTFIQKIYSSSSINIDDSLFKNITELMITISGDNGCQIFKIISC